MATKRIIDLVEDNTPSLDDYVPIDNSSPNTTRRTRVSDLLSAVGGGVFTLYVATRTALKALDTTIETSAILTEAGREGIFKWTTGDYSTQIAADTAEGVYVKADAIAATVGAWVRVYYGAVKAKWFGVVGDGTTNDTSAIQAAINTGLPVELPPSSCKIITRLTSAAGAKLIGLPGSKLYMGTAAGQFDGTSYDAADGTGLLVTHDEFEVHNIHFEMQYADDLAVCAIVLRSCANPKVIGCEFSNFSKSKVLRVESCSNFVISDNYFHDITTDSATTGQVTCVDVDDNRPTGASGRGQITNNLFKDITVGASFEAAYGYQTDAINVSHESSSQHLITGNTIRVVGEGIDCFGKECLIDGNTIDRARAAGIKIIHGASDNSVTNNKISDAKIWGIVIAGSNSTATSTARNLIANNHISKVDVGATSTVTSSGIGMVDNGGTGKPVDNTIQGNVICDSAGADFAIDSNDTGTGNAFLNNRILGTFASARVRNTSGHVMKEAVGAYVEAYANAQSVAAGSAVTIQYANGEIDVTGEYNAATYTFTANSVRRVQIKASFRHGSANIDVEYQFSVYKNGSAIDTKQQIVPKSGDFSMEIDTITRLAVGDTITVRLNHAEGGSITLTSSLQFSALHIIEI